MRLSRTSLGLALGSAMVGTIFWSANWAIRALVKAPRCIGIRTPEDHGLTYSTIRIPTSNQKQLNGWLIPSARSGNAPAIVMLHGWGGNSEMMLPLTQPFHKAGFSLLLIDARCHGRSDEDRFPSLPLFAEDLDHAIDWLRQQPAIDAQNISVLGHSVGAGAALLSASRRDDLRAVVSAAAFAHPEGVIRRLLESKSVPYRPFGWYALRYLERVIGCSFEDMAPEKTITGVRCPVLLVHGRQDETVPVGDAHRICANGRQEQVGLWIVDGDHSFTVDDEMRLSEVAISLANWLLDPTLLPRRPFAKGMDFHGS
jgi:pimeloyl-ACP methyl ester carboxylesterase